MAVDRAILIASNPAAVARLAEPLARAGMIVDAWSPRGSRLGYSRHVRRHRELELDPLMRGEQLAHIAGTVTPRDWVILGTDDDVYNVSDLLAQGVPVAPLLPVERHHGSFHDKATVAGLLQELDVAQPRWTVAQSGDDIPWAVEAVGGRAMVKTVRGSGGRGVTRIDTSDQALAVRGTGTYLVEEFIVGETVSIDLLVVRGEVALAPYSEMEHLDGPLGSSCSRRYLPILDDDLWAGLDRLANGIGGTWLANVTAMRRADGGHVMVELDLRPNVWHAYLARLGFPVSQVLHAVRTGGEPPRHASSRRPHTRVVNVSRMLRGGVRGDLPRLAHLLRPGASWRYANRGDPMLTYREARDFARWLVLTRAGRRRPPAR